MTASTLHTDPDAADLDEAELDEAELDELDPDYPTKTLHKLAAMPRDEPDWARVRDEAVQAWLPLAEHLARRFSGRGEPLEDVVQTACLGLIKAVDRFDVTRGHDFVGFAVPTILGEVKRHFRDHTWDMRVPRRLQELRLAINASADDLAQRLGRSPTTEDLAADLDVSEKEIVEGVGVARAYNVMSLDAVTSGEGQTELGGLVGQEDSDLALAEFRMTLEPALGALPPRERNILIMRFYRNMTQSQIAGKIGISQMHVSRLLGRGLAMLRETLQDGVHGELAGGTSH
jgi:RNA polymerase sigma-B factor